MAADPRAIVALVVLLFIFFSPNPGQEPLVRARSRLEDIITSERHDLTTLNRTRYGDFNPGQESWLNLTGFQKEQRFAWQALDAIKERARRQSAHALGADNMARIEQGNIGQDPLALYNNVTGTLHGSWVRSPAQMSLVAPHLNMSEYAPVGPFGPIPISSFAKNITGQTGSLEVWLEEADTEETLYTSGETRLAREVRAQIQVGDDQQGDSWESRLFGVHFLETGNIVLATTTDKFRGIFALPHLTLSDYNYKSAQALLNRTLYAAINEQEDGLLRTFQPWSPAPEGVSDSSMLPTCDVIVYLQQHLVPLPGTKTGPDQTVLLSFIEQELRFPTGAYLPPTQQIAFSLTAYSPDCGFVLESRGPPDFAPQEGDHLHGLKIEVMYKRGRSHLLLFAATLCAQLFFLVRQMRDSNTPSTRSRISFYTISMLSLGDGFTTMTFCLISLFVQKLWVPLIATAFFAFISASFFGMRFLMDIWAVQAPERERRERQDLQRREVANAATLQSNADVDAPSQIPAASQVPIITPAGADTLPLPTSAPRPTDTGASPVFVPSDQDITAEATGDNQAAQTGTGQRAPGFGALYTRFYFLLLATLFLSLNATSWPPGLRRVYFTLVAFIYLSFWIPQIHRNCIRNCRHALRWDFVAGQSVLRLVPFLYFYGYDQNVLFAAVDLTDLGILATWVWVQVLMMLSQEIIGPRWFVRSTWVPPAYDYHPILRDDAEANNLPIGSTSASVSSPSSTHQGHDKEAKDKNRRVFDCAICMHEIEVPVLTGEAVAEGLSSGSLVLERRRYMVTPCRHIFHSSCLEGWMKFRLVCPIDREELPPL